MPRDALVFDLDGTLSDPLEGIWRSTNHALTCHGAASVDRQAFAQYIGPPLDQTFRTLVPDADDADVVRLVAAFRDRYGTLGYAENVLYPAIPEMLQALTSAGFRCGVCTTKRADFAERILTRFGLSGFFEFVDGADVGMVKAQQLERLLGDGHIDGRALMIGDRASDLEAAATNGLAAVGVAWGYGSREELAAARPLAIADSPRDLARLLLGTC